MYVDTIGYAPVNDPLVFTLTPGTVTYDFGMGIPPVYTETVTDINRWQPLYFDDPKTQNGQVATNTQIFISPHWGSVRPFALTGSVTNGLWHDYDPGPPPYLGGVGDAQMRANVNEVIELSDADIAEAPAFGAKIRTDFIAGMGKIEDKLMILLAVDHVLSLSELSAINGLTDDVDSPAVVNG